MADVPQVTYARIVEDLGGYKAVADELGLTRPAVFRWIQRGIPPHRFAQVEEMARQKGLAWVTLELLHRMRRKGAAPEANHTLDSLSYALRGTPRDAPILVRLPDGSLRPVCLVRPVYVRAGGQEVPTVGLAPPPAGAQYAVTLEMGDD